MVEHYIDAFLNFKATCDFSHRLFDQLVKSKFSLKYRSTAPATTDTQSQQSVIDLDNSSKEESSTDYDLTQLTARTAQVRKMPADLEVMLFHGQKSKTPQKTLQQPNDSEDLNVLFGAN